MTIRKEHLALMLQQIQRGKKFIEEQTGDKWTNHIDPDILDLASATYCAAGQALGWENMKSIIEEENLGETAQPSYYGFDIDDSIYNEYDSSRELYSCLTELWIQEYVHDTSCIYKVIRKHDNSVMLSTYVQNLAQEVATNLGEGYYFNVSQ